jgi:hypothetical protein
MFCNLESNICTRTTTWRHGLSGTSTWNSAFIANWTSCFKNNYSIYSAFVYIRSVKHCQTKMKYINNALAFYNSWSTATVECNKMYNNNKKYIYFRQYFDWAFGLCIFRSVFSSTCHNPKDVPILCINTFLLTVVYYKYYHVFMLPAFWMLWNHIYISAL